MRVTSISLIPNNSESITLDLRNIEAKSQYVVRNVVGLDADDIIPRFYGFSKDGTKDFYEFKLKPRDIVIRIVLNPRYNLNETHSDIRDTIYRAISATRSGQLQLQFYSGAACIAQIYGHMVKLEAPYFSKTPEVQLTIRCNDPMFRGITPVLMPAAILPTTNPVKIADSLSTAPHGFTMKLTFTGTASSFTIQDKATNPEWDFKIIPITSFVAGDVLYFSSEFTNRYLYYVRSGFTTNLLDRVNPSSVWPIIFPTLNSFHFTNIAVIDLDYIRFDAAYWGV